MTGQDDRQISAPALVAQEVVTFPADVDLSNAFAMAIVKRARIGRPAGATEVGPHPGVAATPRRWVANLRRARPATLR